MYEYSRRFGRWIVLDKRNARKWNTERVRIHSMVYAYSWYFFYSENTLNSNKLAVQNLRQLPLTNSAWNLSFSLQLMIQTDKSFSILSFFWYRQDLERKAHYFVQALSIILFYFYLISCSDCWFEPMIAFQSDCIYITDCLSPEAVTGSRFYFNIIISHEWGSVPCMLETHSGVRSTFNVPKWWIFFFQILLLIRCSQYTCREMCYCCWFDCFPSHGSRVCSVECNNRDIVIASVRCNHMECVFCLSVANRIYYFIFLQKYLF